MVNFSEKLIDFRRNIEGVVNGACSVEQDHTGDEDGQRKNVGVAGGSGCFDEQRAGCKNSKKHGDKMGQRTAGVFDLESHKNASLLNEYVRAAVLLRIILKTFICSNQNYIMMFNILYNWSDKNARFFKKNRKEIKMLKVLYEDPHVIVVWKPVGIESQSARGFGADMVSEIKRHIHKLSPKSGEPYLGVIHRLDRPVSGVMVYAKDKKAAAALSKQVSDHRMGKKYLAVICGTMVDNVDNFVDYLLKEEKENRSRIVDKGINGAKRAELSCQVIERKDTKEYGMLTLAEITLKTGRHHQIRVQMAGHGLPLWGDQKYNPDFGGSGQGGAADRTVLRSDVALASWQLSFFHPVSGELMTFSHMPEGRIFQEFRFCSRE